MDRSLYGTRSSKCGIKNSLLSVHILKHFKFRGETPVPVKRNTLRMLEK